MLCVNTLSEVLMLQDMDGIVEKHLKLFQEQQIFYL